MIKDLLIRAYDENSAYAESIYVSKLHRIKNMKLDERIELLNTGSKLFHRCAECGKKMDYEQECITCELLVCNSCVSDCEHNRQNGDIECFDCGLDRDCASNNDGDCSDCSAFM